jgi:hypothetical protein
MHFVIAELIALTISGIISLIGIVIILSSAELSTLILLSPREFMSRITSVLYLIEGIIKASAFFIISGLTWTFFKTGLYGMAVQALRGRTNYKTMVKASKRNGITGVLTTILTSLMSFFLLVFLILGLGFIFPAGAIIGIFLFFFIVILFSLILPGIVVDQLNSIESIKASVKIVKKNYIEMLSLILFYGILSLIINMIPMLGTIVFIFVLTPMVWISLVMFYKRNK